MKTTILALATVLTFSSTQAQWGGKKIKGNGNMTTESRSTSDYDAIHCAGSLDYILVAGKEGNLKLEGESNLLEYVETEVKGNKLIIKTENGVYLKPSGNKTIKITIPFESISQVSLSGSGDVWNEDVISESNFSSTLTGSGDVVLNIKSTNAEAKVTGSGDLTLKGSTENLTAKVTGSGDFHGFDLNSKNTDVGVTGSGDAKVVSTENLRARVTGSGDIRYKGNPNKEDTKVSGSGSISN
ncbi:MAG: head GIN domain-containing protein [Bacteroidota bacterium]